MQNIKKNQILYFDLCILFIVTSILAETVWVTLILEEHYALLQLSISGLSSYNNSTVVIPLCNNVCLMVQWNPRMSDSRHICDANTQWCRRSFITNWIEYSTDNENSIITDWIVHLGRELVYVSVPSHDNAHKPRCGFRINYIFQTVWINNLCSTKRENTDRLVDGWKVKCNAIKCIFLLLSIRIEISLGGKLGQNV